jgi:hypothetical protein
MMTHTVYFKNLLVDVGFWPARFELLIGRIAPEHVRYMRQRLMLMPPISSAALGQC